MCKFAQFVLCMCVCVASATPAFAQVDGRERLEGAIVLPPLTDFMEGREFKIRPATEKDKGYDIQTELMLGKDATIRVYAVKNPQQKYLMAGDDLELTEEADGIVTLFQGGVCVSVVRNGIFLVDAPVADTVQLSFRKAGKGSKMVRETLKGGQHMVFVPEGVLVVRHYTRNKPAVEIEPLKIPLGPMPEEGPVLQSLDGPVAGEEPKPRR